MFRKIILTAALLAGTLGIMTAAPLTARADDQGSYQSVYGDYNRYWDRVAEGRYPPPAPSNVPSPSELPG
jgi:hypothetical protein